VIQNIYWFLGQHANALVGDSLSKIEPKEERQKGNIFGIKKFRNFKKFLRRLKSIFNYNFFRYYAIRQINKKI